MKTIVLIGVVGVFADDQLMDQVHEFHALAPQEPLQLTVVHVIVSGQVL